MRYALVALASALGLLVACQEPRGLGDAVPTGGPRVVWDLDHRPLPAIPFPNDVATRPDPTSATGRRLNISLIASTRLEREVRRRADRLEGFSTTAPAWVEFDAPLDLIDLRRRHVENDDPADDAVYLVDLERGERVPLDMCRGNYPVTLEQTDWFFKGKQADLRAWDPRRDASNMLFETAAEDLDGDGVMDPGEDSDQDGVLDRPNLWPDADPSARFAAYDKLLTCFERETNTLILQPLVPLRPARTYAVLLTGRLRGEDGRAVESPFAYLHHLDQTGALAGLPDLLGQPALGLHLGARGPGDHDYLAFAWTFTTQPIADDLLAVRAGLYGQGPLAWLGAAFPADITWDPIHSERTSSGACCYQGDFYRVDEALSQQILGFAVGAGLFANLPEAQAAKVEADLQHVAALAFGRFTTPDLTCYRQNAWEVNPYQARLDELVAAQPEETVYEERWAAALEQLQAELEPAAVCSAGEGAARSVQPVDLSDEVWELDRRTGEARVCPDEVPVLLVIPKETATRRQPFPVAIYYHGYTLSRLEALTYIGYLAKQGIATLGIDAPGHGVPLYPADMALYRLVLDGFYALPAMETLGRNRARGLLRNGLTDDSGGDYWTAETFHTRDMVRQTVVDAMQLIRALKRYDGQDRSWNVTDHPGLPAGDFDGNGVPDIGGPDNQYFIWGQSLGGIIAMIVPAVEPSITAAAPVSGGGLLTGIAYRSVQGGVREGAQLPMLGPGLVLGPEGPDGVERGPGEVYVHWYTGRFYYDDFLAVGPLAAEPGDTVVARNLDNGLEARARLPESRRLMLALQADALDRVELRAEPHGGGPARGRLAEWSTPLRHQGQFFCPGDPLVAPTAGWGYRRNTPDVRRFMAIAQLILDPADPLNYARHVFLEPLTLDDHGDPHRANLLLLNTAGDMNVPIQSGFAYARAAGLLDHDGSSPRCPGLGGPDSPARYGSSANDMLIRNHVFEAIERLERFRVFDPSGKHTPDGQPGEIWGLFDPDDLDQGADGTNAPSPAVPLRSTRATLTAAELTEWEANGCGRGPEPAGESGMRIPYIMPTGAHTFEWAGPPHNPYFEIRYYLGNLVATFFREGRIRDELCLEDQDACGTVEPLP